MLTSGEKVCCNCKHKRVENNSYCYCDVDDHYIGYIISMTYSCEKWEEKEDPKK